MLTFTDCFSCARDVISWRAAQLLSHLKMRKLKHRILEELVIQQSQIWSQRVWIQSLASLAGINIKFIEISHIIQSRDSRWVNALSYHVWKIKIKPRFLISYKPMFYRIASMFHSNSHFAWIAVLVSVNLEFSCLDDSINVLCQCKC